MNKPSKALFIWGVIALIPLPFAYSQSFNNGPQSYTHELLSLSTMRSSSWPGELEIHIIDVGQGSSELIIGPDGTSILIDGGTSGKGQDELLPYFNSIFGSPCTLDYVICSHDNNDHYGGLNYILDNGYSANTIYHCGVNSGFGRGVKIDRRLSRGS